MINKLFVYGTLGPGRPNEHVLSNIGGSWEKASVTGILHQEGWGAAMGYPGITLDETGDRVEGFLFTSDTISDHWTELDQFEGLSVQSGAQLSEENRRTEFRANEQCNRQK